MCEKLCIRTCRDSDEALGELTEEKKKEITLRENNASHTVAWNYAPRKEKALKIYSEDSSSANHSLDLD